MNHRGIWQLLEAERQADPPWPCAAPERRRQPGPDLGPSGFAPHLGFLFPPFTSRTRLGSAPCDLPDHVSVIAGLGPLFPEGWVRHSR
jgi:hypothetical protein